MEIDFIAYPWSAYQAAFERGSLADGNHPFDEADEAIDPAFEDAPQFSDYVGDSYTMYKEVRNAGEELIKHPFEAREVVAEFFQGLLRDTHESDLPMEEVEGIVAVLSGPRVKQLANIARGIRLEDMGRTYRRCREDTDMLEQDEFMDYVIALIDFVKGAAREDRCLAVYMG